MPVMTSRKLAPAKTPGSLQNRNPYRSCNGLLDYQLLSRIVISVNSPSNHRDKGVEYETEDEEDLGNAHPELRLAKPAYRIEIQETDCDQARRDENCRMRRRPILDDDVESDQFEAYQSPLGDDVLC